jgi:hypothetical protein
MAASPFANAFGRPGNDDDVLGFKLVARLFETRVRRADADLGFNLLAGDLREAS